MKIIFVIVVSPDVEAYSPWFKDDASERFPTCVYIRFCKLHLAGVHFM